MSVASLELCRTLHELSGWDDTRDRYYEVDDGIVAFARKDFEAYEFTDKKLGLAPAYDLGYLLRKLPPQLIRKNGGVTKRWQLEVEAWTDIETDEPDGWVASYQSNRNDTGVYTTKGNEAITFADTPEDCAAKLAIELFKQGILRHE